ncbi:MAG TPA: hypothetical protein VN721_14305 [Flavipsychrobacter sp.]|nr:hypothetical protein [Flavipsychrobacter sp.]
MKAILSACLVTFLFTSCSSSTTPSANYEQKKSSLADIERSSPVKFLKITSSHHTNIIQQMVIDGEIANSATLVTYKNVEVRIKYLDKDGVVLDKEKQVIYDSVGPAATMSFKIKTKAASGTKAITVDIVKATPTN